MWSKNRKIDVVINILVFLVAINVFHYGQLLLPVICLILFIENKFKFKVNNWTVFILLCLFGISFCLFSYKLGFYCVMGFTLPMAYYIGSNIKDNSEENLLKLVYIVAFGMALHMFLNFVLDVSDVTIFAYPDYRHLDIWLHERLQLSISGANCVILFASMYYLCFYEKKAIVKTIALILFVCCFIYCFIISRRTQVLMVAIVLFVSFVLDFFIYKNKKLKRKTLIVSTVTIVSLLVALIIVYITNLFGLRDMINSINIVHKFIQYGFWTGRSEILVDAYPLLTKYLWGGQYISTIIDMQIHNLWLDIYDYAGIVPFVLMVIMTIIFIIKMFKIVKSKKLSNKFKLLVISLFICLMIMEFMEPLFTGYSIFIICIIIIMTSIYSKVARND